jgi:hypothetical protein
MSDLMRAVYDAVMPPGSIWTPEEEKEFDQLLDGMAENSEVVRLFLADLANLRRPSKTTLLDDLEKEFGIVKNENLTDDERRAQIAAIKFSKGGNGDKDFLQRAFDTAGFDVQVHENSPPVDPGLLLDSEEYAASGHENNLSADLTSEDWPLVFFVAGDATLNGGGEITDLQYGFINVDSVPTFKRILKAIISMHAWAGVKVIGFKSNYFGFDEDPDANGLGTLADPDVGGFLSTIL